MPKGSRLSSRSWRALRIARCRKHHWRLVRECSTLRPVRVRAVMISAGFSEVRVVEETNDFFVDAASMDDPDRLFTFNPLWPQLDAEQRARIISTIDASLRRTPGRPLAVPTTALIATAIRHLRFATSQEPSSF